MIDRWTVAGLLALAASLLADPACRRGAAPADAGRPPAPDAPALPAADGSTAGPDVAVPTGSRDAGPSGPTDLAAADAAAPPSGEVPSSTPDLPTGAPDASPTAEVSSAAADVAADGEVPPENRTQGERPGPASAEALARRLLAAILADDPAPVTDLVFPVGPFAMLKDLPDPAAYQRRLVRWFEEDLHIKHGELGGLETLEFRSFRFGRCEWVPKWGEGNLIPYWSCRRNRITASAGRREVEIEIRVLINWGQEWYVTHLGPVRR